MSTTEIAGWRFAGYACRVCTGEIRDGDPIEVNEEGEYDGEGWIDRSTVAHAGACPPEE